MTRALLTFVLAVLASTSAASGGRPEPRGDGCPRLDVGAAYADRVTSALRARRDIWGNAVLRTKSGPTYEGARRFLTPLVLARGPQGRRLTASGFHYLAFTQPVGAEGSGSAALHVADGSQILSRRARGPSLTISVGSGGRELYGSCLARLALPRLVQGYLPILQTRYFDAQGTRYLQESFAVRPSEASALVSFVRITADATRARGDVEISLAPGGTTFRVSARTMTSVYFRWSHGPSDGPPLTSDRASYDRALASVVRFWRERLTQGATIDVPAPLVRDAARNLLVQNLTLGWRYSVGNPYQQFSYPEALDVAQVMSAYGFGDVAGAILRRSLSTPRVPYPNWRIGQRLVATAVHYRFFRDRALVAALTPDLRAGVSRLGRQLDQSAARLLGRERFSSDVPDLVYGLHSQAVVWQGLREMGKVWSETGRGALATRCRRLASRLEVGLRRAVRASTRSMPDGSLFVLMRLLGSERPYRSVTEARAGSYWNLVAPYALASGFFAPRSPEARQLLRYLLRHGSRLLGLVRAGAYSLYGRTAEYPTSGVNPVYGLNSARFLADNDRPDQLVLALYGQLAAGMSAGTFVSGEAASVSPLRGDYYRSMYLPPNAASNASFLETLRLMLVHETRDRTGAPHGLELAYATPRAWLEPGKRIEVHRLPTSFGPISFSAVASSGSVHVSIDVPDRSRPTTLRLRLRLPRQLRIARVVSSGSNKEVPWRGDVIDLGALGGHVELTVVTRRRARDVGGR